MEQVLKFLQATKALKWNYKMINLFNLESEKQEISDAD